MVLVEFMTDMGEQSAQLLRIGFHHIQRYGFGPGARVRFRNSKAARGLDYRCDQRCLVLTGTPQHAVAAGIEPTNGAATGYFAQRILNRGPELGRFRPHPLGQCRIPANPPKSIMNSRISSPPDRPSRLETASRKLSFASGAVVFQHAGRPG